MDLERSRICVSICERTVDALAKAIAKAAQTADLIEIRLDCIASEDLKSSFDQINQLLLSSSIPAILTFRPAEQEARAMPATKHVTRFGKNRGCACRIFAIWRSTSPNSSRGRQFPLESIGVGLFVLITTLRAPAGEASWTGWPGLEQIYKRLSATPAGILKIAVQADDAIFCLPIFNLLERGRREGRKIIAIAMGTSGIATRILGPSRGAFLTYAALENETATAPGQTTARELREVYRIEEIDLQTKIFGLIGLPVSHSVSPKCTMLRLRRQS